MAIIQRGESERENESRRINSQSHASDTRNCQETELVEFESKRDQQPSTDEYADDTDG